jgi:hypothetical protein
LSELFADIGKRDRAGEAYEHMMSGKARFRARSNLVHNHRRHATRESLQLSTGEMGTALPVL